MGTIHNVRRQCYPPDSPAGKGAKWEWAGDMIGEWHTYDMDIQCLIEEAWAKVRSISIYFFIFDSCFKA